MKWLELTLETEPECVDAISEVFQRYGHGGVVVEQAVRPEAEPEDSPIDPKAPVKVRTYMPLDDSVLKKEEIVRALACLSLITSLPPLAERVLEEEDWANAWKAHFQVQRIGRRIVIKPSWCRYRARKGDAVVSLDPGMAFGTGLHTTTRMCLAELERRLKPGLRVLDLGTGSGIQAIAAARLGAGYVLAVDKDPVAVEVARENVRRNRVGRCVTVLGGSLPLPEEFAGGGFDLAVANITATVLIALSGPLLGVLRPDGLLIAGGILGTRAGEVSAAFGTAGGEVLDRASEGDWCILVVQRAEA